MIAELRPPRLVAETREIDPVDDLLRYTDPDDPLAWLRRSDGIVGLGKPVIAITRGGTADVEPVTAGAIPGHAEAWRWVTSNAATDDPLRLPGTGLVAFGAFAFDPRSQRSNLLVIPPARDRPTRRAQLDHPHPQPRRPRRRARPRRDAVRAVLVGDPRTRARSIRRATKTPSGRG